MVKICPKCKVENIDDASFCDNCGNAFNGTNPEYNSNKKLYQKIKSIVNWNQKGNKFKIFSLLIICFIGTIIVLGLGNSIGSLVFTSNSYDDNQVSFDYIKGWKIFGSNTNNGKIIEGYYDFNGPINLTITKETSNDSLNNFITTWHDKTFNNSNSITSEKPIIVDGVNAYEYTSKSLYNNKYVILNKKNNFYIITFTTESDLFSYRRSIDTIVNSFHVK